MMNWWNRLWMWLRVLFTGNKSLREIADDIKSLMPSNKRKLSRKHRGKMIWDARLGTYRRRAPKIGRNAPCPCGAMRTAPRDVTQRNKYKWCCGANR